MGPRFNSKCALLLAALTSASFGSAEASEAEAAADSAFSGSGEIALTNYYAPIGESTGDGIDLQLTVSLEHAKLSGFSLSFFTDIGLRQMTQGDPALHEFTLGAAQTLFTYDALGGEFSQAVSFEYSKYPSEILGIDDKYLCAQSALNTGPLSFSLDVNHLFADSDGYAGNSVGLGMESEVIKRGKLLLQLGLAAERYQGELLEAFGAGTLTGSAQLNFGNCSFSFEREHYFIDGSAINTATLRLEL